MNTKCMCKARESRNSTEAIDSSSSIGSVVTGRIEEAIDNIKKSSISPETRIEMDSIHSNKDKGKSMKMTINSMTNHLKVINRLLQVQARMRKRDSQDKVAVAEVREEARRDTINLIVSL